MKSRWAIVLWAGLALSLAGGTIRAKEVGKPMGIKKELFGKTADGRPVYLYTLTNRQGMRATITNYGGIVTSLWVPDKNGQLADVVLGFDSLKDYEGTHPYFGALIGRYGNRIARGLFAVDGREYRLATNNGRNHLHGGLKGFDKVLWNARESETPQGPALHLTYHSPDGEEGYPGNLAVRVTYLLTEDNGLRIRYEARTDRPTPVNLTHHSYFNLKGAGSGDILGELLQINADSYTAVDAELIPTGVIKPVAGTPLDFASPHTIGERIAQVEGGYDHNYVLNRHGNRLSPAARVIEPTSGRVLEVYTTEPGLQFYSGNFLDGTLKGKGGKIYNQHDGYCLETQHFPDSPHHANFPSTILFPGKIYHHLTVYKFSVIK